MEKKYSRTNIFIMNDKLWKWAKYKAETLKYGSVSEYLFELITQEYVIENVQKLDNKTEGQE